MATTAQVLALLTGAKVFDGALWRVYDAGGTELADPGGVLWRGVHGALLWGAAEEAQGQVYGKGKARARRPDDLTREEVEAQWDLLEARLRAQTKDPAVDPVEVAPTVATVAEVAGITDPPATTVATVAGNGEIANSAIQQRRQEEEFLLMLCL